VKPDCASAQDRNGAKVWVAGNTILVRDSRYREPRFFTSVGCDECNTLFHPFDIDSYWFILDRLIAVKKILAP
jgi:hypothetical protein